MELVTIKNKFQIVIPHSIRTRARLEVGDLLEAGIENGKITFTPKFVIDRHLAEGLQDLAEGRTHGPYNTADEAIAALNVRTTRKSSSSKKRR
jgi:AbrB family looped-hinge helix DNA binding protein